MDIPNPNNSQIPRFREIDLDKILHFGAIISLTPSEDEYIDHCMFTDGFAVKNIILKAFTDGQDDFSGSLFRIVPPYSYDIQKQMLSKIQSNEMNESSKKKMIVFIDYNFYWNHSETK